MQKKKQRKTINGKDQRSLKKNWRYQRNIPLKDGHTREQKCKDLTETEEIKKRLQKYPKELYKEGINDSDNHDGVITHVEKDILEHEAKWALGSLTMNKASRGDGISAELLQI